MSYPIDRVQLFDRSMNPLRELAPNEVLSRVRSEEVNGEHSLTIVTTRKLQEGWRALTVDGMGTWREWVVTEPDEEHQSGKHALGTYRFVWSLQYDLTYSYSHTHAEVGYGEMTKTAQGVAEKVLQDVPNWTVGTCDAANIADGKGAVFIYESAWSRLSKAVEVMGCEVESQIEVSNIGSVTARKLCLRAHVGSDVAHRRFDWGYDLTSVKRTPDPGPYYCRVVPLGRGEQEYAEDDETTFDWPLDITEETGTKQNPGPYYIQDDEAAATFRIKLADGSYYYPTVAVNYDEDDPELLLKAAREDLHNHTRPGVTYEASVLQLAQAGMNVQGVALGDDVQVVDRGFNADAALRIQGRVMKIEVDELSPETTMQLTIGQLKNNMTDVVGSINANLSQVIQRNNQIYHSVANMSTAKYIDELLNRINAEINATGGYAYLVPGEGILTYDVAVEDPITGRTSQGGYATKVVQIKGGSIRIADSKKSAYETIDDWNWRTVFTADGINADLVTAVKITSGFIGNMSADNYWNLDTGTITLKNGYIGDSASGCYWNLGTGELLLRTITNWFTDSSGIWQKIETKHGVVASDVENANILTGQGVSGKTHNVTGLRLDGYWSPFNGTSANWSHTGSLIIVPANGLDNVHWSSIASNGNIHIISNYSPTSSSLVGILKLDSFTGTGKANVSLGISTKSAKGEFSSKPYMAIYNDAIHLNASTSSLMKLSSTSGVTITGMQFTSTSGAVFRSGAIFGYIDDDSLSNTYAHMSSSGLFFNSTSADTNKIHVSRSSSSLANLTVSGTKSREVNTESYGDRLLYCYETPTPLFGDIGSSILDENGITYVMIDGVFGETTRTNFTYQVFLQKCGEGDLWVEEKNPSYFIVKGTPLLPFDWELKGRQRGLENIRLEERNIRDACDMTLEEFHNPADVYDDYIADFEHIYDDEITATQGEPDETA